MKFKPNNLLLVLCILCIYSCSKHSTPVKEIKISEYNDTIISLYKLGKNKKSPTTKRLNYLDTALSICYKYKTDSVLLIDIYSLKNAIFSKTKSKDSSLFYAKRMLDISINKRDSLKIGKAYFKIASYYKTQSQFDSAYYFFDLSKQMFLSQNDSSQVGRRMTSMSRILVEDHDFYESETTALEALTYLEDKDSLYIARVYNTLAISLRFQNELKKSLIFHDSAINNTKSKRDRKVFINSKAVTLKKAKKYKQAIRLYSDLLKSSLIKNNKSKDYIRVFDNLTYAKWLADSTLDIETDLLNTLNSRETINDVQGLIASNEHLMDYYSKKNIQKANKHAFELYKLTVQQNNVEDRLSALLFLKDHSGFKKSKNYADLYIKISDSINRARETSKKKYAIIRYDSRKDREKAIKLKAKNVEQELLIQQKQKQNIIYAGSGLLILISSIFIFLYLRTRHRKEKLQEIYKTETRISKKVHDELANDMYQVMTQLQTKNTDNTVPVLDQLEDIYSRTRDISRENNSIDTGIQYTNELRSMVSRYGSDQTNIVIHGLTKEHWTNIPYIKKIEVYRVLQELMTNMKKHSKASLVAITFKKEGNQMIINYKDNGIGFSEIQQNIANGIHNVENRINAIDGSAIFDKNTEKGVKANISFPA